jgi:hypothetical protein
MAGVFLGKIASLLGKTVDPEVEKRNLLKSVRKDIQQNDFRKFFKLRTSGLEPPMAQFFYDLYKPLAQTQILMQNVAKSARLKQLIVEYFMDNNLIALQKRLEISAIEERAKTTDVKTLSAQVKNDLTEFSAAFNSNRLSSVDRCYNLMLAFTQFVTFDFFRILSKFDASFTVKDPKYQPKFGHVRAETLLDALKDFLEIAYPIDKGENWATLFKILKTFKNDVDVVDTQQWNKVLSTLYAVQQSSIIVLIIRLTEQNPVWQSSPNFPQEQIVKAYLEGIQTDVTDCIDKLVNAKRYAQIAELAATVFDSPIGERMKYYTAKNGEIYVKKNLGKFQNTAEINYLKAFLLDYCKKDIRELCDLFLIRGQWTTNGLSKKLSDAFLELTGLSEKVLAFDETLAETGDAGSRLKNYLLKAERDKGVARSLSIVLSGVNDEARRLSTAAAKALVVIGTELKNLCADYEKSIHELIVNWKEIESVSEVPIPTRISKTYKKIHGFVTILHLFMNPEA